MVYLLYLRIAAMEYESSQAAASEFIDSVQNEVLKRVVRNYVYSEELLYLLFRASSSQRFRHRILSGKALGSSILLRSFLGSRGNGSTSIYCYFCPADDAEGVGSEVLQWDIDALRQEIHGPPYRLWTILQRT